MLLSELMKISNTYKFLFLHSRRRQVKLHIDEDILDIVLLDV